mgnify:CR=1 FL=1
MTTYTTNRPAVEISIVIPAFNESQNISVIYQELENIFRSNDSTWELIFIDDGSTDNTWSEIERLHGIDQSVCGLRLSRNFGHQYALFAGLNAAHGNAVISMDADLQHPPSIVPELISEWRKGNKIVNTIREDAANLSFFKKITSKIFYRVFSYLSGVKLEQGMADFRLIDRQVLDQILQFKEEGLFLRGLVRWVGYPSTSITFQCADRFSGVSKYTTYRMLKFAWHGISSFSIVPLRIGIAIGILTSLLSLYFLLEAIYANYVLGTTVPGWTSTIGVISLLFGILFIFLGLLGEYIGRILVQVRGRPLYLVSKTVGVDDEND